MASLKGDNSVVYHYLKVTEICPDKRGGLSQGGQFSSISLSEICPDKRGGLLVELFLQEGKLL